MKFTGTVLFVSAAYLAALVSADPIVSITSPLINTQYKVGSEAIISWIDPTVVTIPQIVLARGKSNALQPLRTIATNVNAADMKYVWTIPQDLESADDYAFELGNSPNFAFAGPFTIEGGAGGPAAAGKTTNTTTSTPNTASSPSTPANNAGSTSSSTASGSTSSTSPHNANSSHTSAATKQNMGQDVVALGLVAVFASQFF